MSRSARSHLFNETFGTMDAPWGNPSGPLTACLDTERPSVDVVRDLAMMGCPITENHFLSWIRCNTEPSHLRQLYLVLIEFAGRLLLPRFDILKEVMQASSFHGRVKRREFRSKHIDALRGYVVFKYEDAEYASERGFSSLVEQIAEDKSLKKKERAAIYRLAHLSRYGHYSDRAPELSLLRKSLKLMKDINYNVPRISYDRWTLFNSEDDLDRLEKQISSGDYLEWTWQMFMMAAQLGVQIRALKISFFRYIDDIEEMLKINISIFKCCRFSGSPFERDELAMYIRNLHDIFTRSRAPVSLGTLSYLFESLEFIHPSKDRISAICMVFQTIDPSMWRDQLEALGPDRRDRFLFNVADTVRCQKLALTDEEYSTMLSLILLLLNGGASIHGLMDQPGTTLSILVDAFNPMPSLLQETLAKRLCCNMDFSDKDLKAFGDLALPKVPKLTCLAATTCSHLPRCDYLSEGVPEMVLGLVYGHREYVRHFKPIYSRRRRFTLEKVCTHIE